MDKEVHWEMPPWDVLLQSFLSSLICNKITADNETIINKVLNSPLFDKELSSEWHGKYIHIGIEIDSRYGQHLGC